MDESEIIKSVADHVREKFQGEGSGHDWWHIYRVWQNAKTIAASEECDIFVVEMGALLHDIADHKFHGGDEEIGGKTAEKILSTMGVNEDIVRSVVYIVNNLSYSKNINNKRDLPIEGEIVQDADRLDAIGAIGIARCFAYGGSVGNEIYNPEIKPDLAMDKERYKKGKSPQINHFYEKLLLLKDMMNTDTGRQLAQQRHIFMQNYLEEFFAEWEGER
ncbi:HD domain-containing protein [candidate division WWE3 bacterium]|uniref:HD domain-containing protein n=1 Tax=candidate division WWE3 bacterium TaxID=2053526 RepID=A0A955LJT1_UNCKA|nr:HD domain-containing protein [candidate division WWE3 bacterium]